MLTHENPKENYATLANFWSLSDALPFSQLMRQQQILTAKQQGFNLQVCHQEKKIWTGESLRRFIHVILKNIWVFI